MLVLIDESGCPGFKLTKGSTRYFLVAMIIFTDFLEAEKTSKAIEELRKKLKINPEFKFSKTHALIKDSFFEVISNYAFDVRVLVIDKTNIYSTKLRNDTDAFYSYFVKTLMQYDSDILSNASIKIDGSGNREFKQKLSTYLRQQIGQYKIKKIKIIDSKKDNLIQLADMVVGAISRHYSQKRTDSSRWFNMLKSKNRIKDIWNFR